MAHAASKRRCALSSFWGRGGGCWDSVSSPAEAFEKVLADKGSAEGVEVVAELGVEEASAGGGFG